MLCAKGLPDYSKLIEISVSRRGDVSIAIGPMELLNPDSAWAIVAEWSEVVGHPYYDTRAERRDHRSGVKPPRRFKFFSKDFVILGPKWNEIAHCHGEEANLSASSTALIDSHIGH